MVRIRFLERTVYDTNGPGLGPVYAAGEVVEVTPDVAERWFRRGKAEAVADAPKPAAAPKPAPAPVAAPVAAPAAEKIAPVASRADRRPSV
jgi:hypothetical protein